MAEPPSERKHLALKALAGRFGVDSSAVELELSVRTPDSSPRPTIGYFWLPASLHSAVFPRLHEAMAQVGAASVEAAPFDDLAARIVEVDDDARKREEQNLLAILEAMLRYGLLHDIDLGYLLGPQLPPSSLALISRFSVRNTWIGTVSGPVGREQELPDVAGLTRAIAQLPSIGFILSPDRSVCFDPSKPVAFTDFVLSQGAGRPRDPLKLDVSLDVVSAPELSPVPSTPAAADKIAIRPPRIDAIPSTGAYAISAGGQPLGVELVPFLYTALDRSAATLSQELHGFKRERSDASFLALDLSNRYGRTVTLTSREQAYLDLATDQLGTAGHVSPSVADPLLLPDSVLTPGELQYRALGSLLASLQELGIGRERPDDDTEHVDLLHDHWDLISREQAALAHEVRFSRRRIEHQIADDSAPATHYLFHASFFTFSPDSDEIKRSLLRQATLLQVLNSLSELDLEVDYRLFTTPSPSGELRAHFEVEAAVAGCTAAQAAELRESFGELVHATFVGAYGLNFASSPARQGANEEARLRHPHFEREIVRSKVAGDSYQTFFGRPDWGFIVDYMLTLENPVVIKLRASAGGHGAAPVADHFARPDRPDHSEDGAVSVLNDLLRRVAHTTEQISLRVSVGSNQPISAPLLNLVGTEIGGVSTFDVAPVEAVDADPARTRMSLAEALAIFHAPYGQFFASKIGTRVTRITSSIDTFPVSGIELGTAYRAHARADRMIKVRIPETDALRHMYVVGRTGSGKTNFLRGLAGQHLLSPGTGLAVVDPHGDLAAHILNSVPAARVDEVVTIDVTDGAATPVLNPLAFDGTDALERSRIVQDVLELIKQRLYHEWSGPRFDEMVRLALDTMLDGGYPVAPSLVEIPRILTDAELQAALIKRLHDPELVARWGFHQRLTTTREYPDLMDWVVSKFDDLSRDESLRTILGGQRNTVDIDGVVGSNGILIVRVPEAEVGRQAAEFIGSLVLQRLRRALLRRTTETTGQGHFFVYVDEFQKFATTAFAELVAEARKYGVGVVLAHQNLEQLRKLSPQSGLMDQSLLSAILGNVGSMVCFGVGAPDTDVLASQLGVSASAVFDIGRYEALARLSLNGAWVPTMTLVTELNEPKLDPRRQDEIHEFQLKAERLVPRQRSLQEIEGRRAELTSLAEGERTTQAAKATATPSASFIDSWRSKREAGKPKRRSASTAPKKRKSPKKRSPASAPSKHARRDRAHVGNRTQARRPNGADTTQGNGTGVDGTRQTLTLGPQKIAAPPRGRGEGAWAKLIGPVVRLDRVAELLGESVDVLRGRAELNRMLILETRRGTEVVPASHFVEGRPLPGLDDVTQSLAGTDWTLWSRAGWLATPLDGLGGRTVIGWLRAGLDPVMPVAIAAARAHDD